MSSSNQQEGLHDGFTEETHNSQGEPYFVDNGEEMTLSSGDNILTLNDANFLDDESNAGKNKKVSRIIGWGLRRFSTIVCKKVKAKGRTTYNEVADEIIAELASGSLLNEQFDEKNIRRRVYDVFNVLIAINVIAKDKKELRWIGFPVTNNEQAKELKETRRKLTNRSNAKTNYIEELEQQVLDLQKLILRNQQSKKSNSASPESIQLPFVLVKTNPRATVEIQISEDSQLVHFDFNETPYNLYDGHALLKMMRNPKAALSEHTSKSSSDESIITDQSGRPLKPSSFSWNSVDNEYAKIQKHKPVMLA